jgi:diaminohydroxyphosphoribosylaminopyrimidine deaminase / 5-amino-6-(5-phosphoribosylamino)uracil reductase
MAHENDQYYMRLALREARKGLGKTSPNPCVGAVIVKNNEILAKGYHKKAGTPHAEIHALRQAGDRAGGATLYVTLEPCNHTGKTPPCSHAVAAAGISRVVAGMEDPNPLVHGSGFAYLQEQGIQTVSGILEEECRRINQPFIKYIATGLPWLVMKAGVSLDGRLNYQRGMSGWITGEKAAKKVHRLRSQYDAILVGGNTIRIDNPSLNVRLPGKIRKDPVRIILDSKLSLPLAAKVFHLDSTAPTWVFCGPQADQHVREELSALGIIVYTVDSGKGGLDLRNVLQTLGRLGITSVLVEGGARIHGSFLRERLYDYAHIFVGTVFAGEGGAPLLQGYGVNGFNEATRLKDMHYEKMGMDVMISGTILYPNENTYIE